jgi:hypothetical protein
MFRLFFGLFADQKKQFYGLFRFDSVFRTCIETAEQNKTASKQTENRKTKKPCSPSTHSLFKRIRPGAAQKLL